MTKTKLNKIDRQNLSAGMNAVVWPFLLFSPMGFRAGIAVSGFCVLVTATVLFIRNRKRYVGCDWRSHLLTFVPGLAYWTLATALHLIFG